MSGCFLTLTAWYCCMHLYALDFQKSINVTQSSGSIRNAHMSYRLGPCYTGHAYMFTSKIPLREALCGLTSMSSDMSAGAVSGSSM